MNWHRYICWCNLITTEINDWSLAYRRHQVILFAPLTFIVHLNNHSIWMLTPLLITFISPSHTPPAIYLLALLFYFSHLFQSQLRIWASFLFPCSNETKYEQNDVKSFNGWTHGDIKSLSTDLCTEIHQRKKSVAN